MYKVLIVEDEKVIADTLAAHLNKWGYEAVCVTDFQNVLEEFEREKPHIVLMDIGLPFFNGYHWCTQIRAQSKVPVIFLSSMSDNMNIVMAINMGGDDFITKPMTLMWLWQRCRHFLEEPMILLTIQAQLSIMAGC